MSDSPYRLQALLDLRERAVEAAVADLARAGAAVADARAALAARQADLAAHDGRITSARAALVPAGRSRPEDLTAARAFHDRLVAERETWLAAVRTAGDAVDAAEQWRATAHAALTRAHQEHELVDRHRKRTAAEAARRAEARAEAEADDRAAHPRPGLR